MKLVMMSIRKNEIISLQKRIDENQSFFFIYFRLSAVPLIDSEYQNNSGKYSPQDRNFHLKLLK